MWGLLSEPEMQTEVLVASTGPSEGRERARAMTGTSHPVSERRMSLSPARSNICHGESRGLALRFSTSVRLHLLGLWQWLGGAAVDSNESCFQMTCRVSPSLLCYHLRFVAALSQPCKHRLNLFYSSTLGARYTIRRKTSSAQKCVIKPQGSVWEGAEGQTGHCVK